VPTKILGIGVALRPERAFGPVFAAISGRPDRRSAVNDPAMKRIPSLPLYLLMALLLSAALPACKGKQKAAERERAELLARQTEQAKSDLIDLLSDQNGMTLEEKEAALERIRQLGLEDPEVRDLIAKAEDKIAAERAEADRLRAEETEKLRAEAEKQAKQRALSGAFAQIANANTPAAANLRIEETLRLFASPDAPVLIIIAEEGGVVDYDRPTTIRQYLEHVKDTGSVEEALSRMTMDDRGLIAELELRKR
jgi:hypothetical protein